ncbi:VOC family protein [Agrococcus baldri]|uniref:VOC domain-containing protein n=1 Tax=Agrococcus baldri TaxID=153730 RepID=A0AA87RGN3_9MICO|nr:VOC family protein [Agrococcus baldri]GEK79248.1 hypothetical protein ABA31_05990 [Agrococcus baldri]
MGSLVVHFEIHASEPQRLIDFYGRLLGWRFTRQGAEPYWIIDTGQGSVQPGPRGEAVPGLGINGGLAQREGAAPATGAPVAGATLVVGVDDADACFARGVELGAAQAVPPYDMAGVGRIAYLVDPDGNVFGLISEVLSDGTSVLAEQAGGLEEPLHGEAQAVDPMRVTPEP